VENLDGDMRAERQVLGFVDRTHPAIPEQPEKLVFVADDLAQGDHVPVLTIVDYAAVARPILEKRWKNNRGGWDPSGLLGCP
jgi:hypothetical protein